MRILAETRLVLLRKLWLNVHLWVGVGLAVLLIAISISGSLLVFHDEIDALINPSRYAVSGTKVSQPASVYLDNARQAAAADPDRLALRPAPQLRLVEQCNTVTVSTSRTDS